MNRFEDISLKHLFAHADNQLGNILAKVKALQHLQSIVAKYVDSDIAQDLKVANYRQGCLVIQFTNGAAATKFRYQIPQLLQMLRTRENLPGLASIKYQVRPQEQDVS